MQIYLKEAKDFFDKALEVKELENVDKVLFFVFSAAGFYKNAIRFFDDNRIAWSEDKRLLDNHRAPSLYSTKSNLTFNKINFWYKKNKRVYPDSYQSWTWQPPFTHIIRKSFSVF